MYLQVMQRKGVGDGTANEVKNDGESEEVVPRQVLLVGFPRYKYAESTGKEPQ